MRLFGIPTDNTIDRFDRAGILTIPFDVALASPAPIPERLCFTAEAFGIPSFSVEQLILPSFAAEALKIPSSTNESFEVCE